MVRRLIFAALLCSALVVPASASANDRACGLITTAQLKQALGGSNYGYVWSGAKPASRQAALAALHAGKASLFAIDTWRPDPKSRSAKTWIKTQFPLLVKNADGLAVLPDLPSVSKSHARTFAPKSYG